MILLPAVKCPITYKRAVTYGAVVFLCTALSAAAQNSPDIAPQTGGSVSNPGLNGQPGSAPSSKSGMTNQGGQSGDDTTLEISPQSGIRPPNPSSSEIPSNREFQPNDDTATLNRNFRPGEQDTNLGRGEHPGNAHSCLGIHVNYTNYCFKGAEEHGLEVVSIDHNGPAEKAGLKASNSTGGKMITAAETASAFLGPLQLLTNGLLEKAGQGERGDLIVAVDDLRVRSQADLDDAMAKARPGDTLYLTVIRPLPGGDHKTMKIAVNVGNWQSGDADSCGEFTASAKPSG